MTRVSGTPYLPVRARFGFSRRLGCHRRRLIRCPTRSRGTPPLAMAGGRCPTNSIRRRRCRQSRPYGRKAVSWSTVADQGAWLAFQLERLRQPGAADSPSSARRRCAEMHKPTYLGDDDWTSALGISWKAVRRNDVTWITHSGGLPGFTSTICFDPVSQAGAVVLINGTADRYRPCLRTGRRAPLVAPRQAPPLLSPRLTRCPGRVPSAARRLRPARSGRLAVQGRGTRRQPRRHRT